MCGLSRDSSHTRLSAATIINLRWSMMRQSRVPIKCLLADLIYEAACLQTIDNDDDDNHKTILIKLKQKKRINSNHKTTSERKSFENLTPKTLQRADDQLLMAFNELDFEALAEKQQSSSDMCDKCFSKFMSRDDEFGMILAFSMFS